MSHQPTRELTGAEKRGALTVLLMLAGIGGALVCFFSYNIGLSMTEADRLLGFIGSLAIFFTGLLIALFGRVAKAMTSSAETKPAQPKQPE